MENPGVCYMTLHGLSIKNIKGQCILLRTMDNQSTKILEKGQIATQVSYRIPFGVWFEGEK